MLVLYIEDSTVDTQLTQEHFARHAADITLESASCLDEARRRLSERHYDLILCDLRLPDGSGLELLAALRVSDSPPPVVLVTGSGDLKSAVQALKAGAQDYVVKNETYLDALPQVIRDIVRRAKDRPAHGRALEILYAEPNRADAELARHHLERHAPHLHLSVVDGADAVFARLLDRSAARQPDVLLLDYRLPGTDGLEVVHQLRRTHGISLPTILTTAQGSEEVAALAVHLDVDDFIPKDNGYLFALPATIEKVHREHELRRERDMLRSLSAEHAELLASSPTLIYKLRYENGIATPVMLSGNVVRMLGYSYAEATSPGWWWSNIYEDDRDRVAASQPDLLEHGELDLCYRFRHRNGQLLWIRDQERLIRRKPLETVGSWNDVTEEMLSAQVRAARMSIRERMFNGQPLDEILTYCAEQIRHCFPSCHAAIIRLVDNGPPRITDTGLGAAYVEAVADRAATLKALLGDPGQDSQLLGSTTDPVTARDCHRALIEAAGFADAFHLPLRGSNGRLLGLLGAYCTGAATDPGNPDIRRLAEFGQIAALAVERSEQEQLQRQTLAALADTRDGIMITDLRPAIVSVNSAWSDITGYKAEEALGHNPSILKSGLESPALYEEMWKSLLGNGYWQGELWNRRKNGETYPQLLSISTVRDSAGLPTHYVGVMTDLSRLRQSEEERERLTHYDPLTHLPNRLLAISRLQHAIEQAERQGDSIAVLYLDLDLFKHINDSLGHVIGDQVLIEVSRRLQAEVTTDVTLARLGGDEFLLIIERLATPDDAARAASRLIDALHAPLRIDGTQEVFAAGSIGIALFPGDGRTPQALIQHADTALNEAKTRGRDQYCYYTSSLGERVRQRLALESQLRLALERGELSLHYQPQVDIRSGRINGVEALMRWVSPTLGQIPPGEFIPVAEQSGLIFPMGHWALEEACRQNKAWQDQGLPQLCVAVNVSVRQFRDPSLLASVRSALDKSGLPPRCLEIELTESAFVDDAETAIRTSQKLHELGVRLSLDDFGTGYSSLAYLSRFPFDKIKIDQSFVTDITSNPTNAAIANTTIALAESLHMSVLAEGVETESQLNFLRQRGCSSMQGFLFSRALAAAELEALLRESRTLPAPPDEHKSERTLLLLDDEANILRALQRLLRQDGYRILSTTSAAEAFELLAQNTVQVIVSDQRMPEMSGTEFLSRVKDLHPQTIRIVLSGYSEVETITQAVNRGAIYKFFTKPWDDMQLREELREAFRVAEKLRS